MSDKVLLYTISDFKDHSINCIDLLLKSIEFDIDCDFIILSQYESPYPISYRSIYDPTIQSEYIGYLKYSPFIDIDNNYDYYIYLDSDILYFDKISNLLPKNNNCTITKQNTLIGDNEWYLCKYINHRNLTALQNSQALNAGSFTYSKKYKSIINQIYDIYFYYYTNNVAHDAKLEQSIYNYVIYDTFNYDLESCNDITQIVQLFPYEHTLDRNKKLYHFCGFSNEMTSKYAQMLYFYESYVYDINRRNFHNEYKITQ